MNWEVIMSLKKGRTTWLLVLSLVFAAAMLVIVAGCGDEGDGESAEMEEFTYAASGTYPPFSFAEGDTITGFDVELGELLAERMGMTPKFLTNPFETIIEGLTSSKYDSVIGSLAITPEREEVVSFTQPYYNSGAQTYVRADNTDITAADSGAQTYVRADNTDITAAEDLDGKEIGVVKASTFLALAQTLTDPDKCIGFDSDVIALQDLIAGRVDAVITDEVVGAVAMMEGLEIKAVGEPMEVSNMGIAVRKDDTELLDKLNAAIDEIKADGSYKALSEKWLGQVLLEGVQ